jgi:DNA-binding NarL/FixJ family response regulator
MTTRILLVDDHASTREPLAQRLGHEADFSVVAEAATCADARAHVAEVTIDIAVVDLGLPDGDGVTLIKELRQAHPNLAVLVLTASGDELAYARAVDAGAAGVLQKTVRIAEVVAAIRRVGSGETLLRPDEVVALYRLASQRRSEHERAQRAVEELTPREHAVLQALAEGLNDKDIAARLGIGLATVRSHIERLLAKLGAESRLQALVVALRYGLVTIE